MSPPCASVIEEAGEVQYCTAEDRDVKVLLVLSSVAEGNDEESAIWSAAELPSRPSISCIKRGPLHRKGHCCIYRLVTQ